MSSSACSVTNVSFVVVVVRIKAIVASSTGRGSDYVFATEERSLIAPAEGVRGVGGWRTTNTAGATEVQPQDDGEFEEGFALPRRQQRPGGWCYASPTRPS